MMRRLVAAVLLVGGLTVSPPSAVQAAYQRCPQHEARLARHAPVGGWDVARMSYYCWRESRGMNVRSTTRDTGILQINDINLPYLSRTLGRPVTIDWLMKPGNNVRAAAVLCTYWRRAVGNCYQPWGG